MSLNKVLSPQSIASLAHFVAVHRMRGLSAQHSKCSITAESVDAFLAAYADLAAEGGAHLAEMPGRTVPVLVDVDILEKGAVEAEELFADRDVGAVGVAFTRALADKFQLRTATVEFAVLRKAPRIDADKGGCKHGFHLHSLNVAVRAPEARALFQRARLHLRGQTATGASTAPLDAALDDVSGKPWLLYGSTKRPGLEPFRVEQRLVVEVDGGRWTLEDWAEQSLVDTVRLLSLRIPPSPTTDAALVVDPLMSVEETSSAATARQVWDARADYDHEACEDEDSRAARDEDDEGEAAAGDVDEDDETTDAVRFVLLECLAESRADSRDEWLRVCMAMSRLCVVERRLPSATGLALFLEFSQRSAKYDEFACRATWREFAEKASAAGDGGRRAVSFRTVLMMAREDCRAMAARGERPPSRLTLTAVRDLVVGDPQGRGGRRTAAPSAVDVKIEELMALENPRQQNPADVIRATLALIDARFFERAEFIDYMVAAVHMETFLTRLREEEAVRVVGEVLAARGLEYTADDVERLFERVAAEEKLSGVRMSELRCRTMGEMFALAEHSSPRHAEFVRRVVAAPPEDHGWTDTDLANALDAWFPWKLMVNADDKGREKWYEFNNVYWVWNRNMKSLLVSRIHAWFAEYIQHYHGLPAGAAFDFPKYPPKAIPRCAALPGREPTDPVAARANRAWQCVGNVRQLPRLVEAVKITSAIVTPGAKAFRFNDNNALTAFQNGVFDANTLEVRAGRMDDWICHAVNADYIAPEDLDAGLVAVVDDFWYKMHPNTEKREYFLDSLAEIFDEGNPRKQYMVLSGSGHNGKSLCMTVLEAMLGEGLMTELQKSTLLARSGREDSGPQPERVCLRAKRFVVTPEVSGNDTLDIGAVKLLSGNDPFSARDLYAGADEFVRVVPAFIPAMVCNSMPVLRKPDAAAWGRIRVFKFESKFVEDVDEYRRKLREGKADEEMNPAFVFPRDARIAKKMTTPEVLSTFASMLLHRYVRNRRRQDAGELVDKPPLSVLEAEVLYRAESNVVKNVVDTKFLYRSPFTTRSADVAAMSEEERADHDEYEARKAEEYSESISLSEIARMIESSGRRGSASVAFVAREARFFAEWFAPYVTWDGETLSGLKRVAF